MNRRQIVGIVVLSGLLIISLLMVPIGLAKSPSGPGANTTNPNSNSTISAKTNSRQVPGLSSPSFAIMSGVFSDGLTITKQIAGSLVVGTPLTGGLRTTNTVSVSSTQVRSPNPADVVSEVKATPQVTVTKTGPTVALVGQTTVFTFSVSNPGNIRLQVNTVDDSFAGDANLDSGDANFDTWLDASETWVYTADFTVPVSTPDPLLSTVTVTATDRPGTQVAASHNHSTAINFQPALAINKTGPTAAAVGDVVTYTITVQHSGSSDQSDINTVVVSDTRAATIVGPFNDIGNDGILADGEVWTYSAAYQVQLSDPDPLPNTASVSGRDLDDEPVPEVSDSHQINIDFQPSLAINKIGPSVALVGELISYTITVQHAAGVDQSDINTVVVSDTRATVVNPDLPAGDVGGDNILSQGETWTFTATYQIQATDPDPLPNTASVSGRDRDNQPVAQVSDSHSLNIDFRPALSITKNGQIEAQIGQPVNYFFIVENDPIAGDGSAMRNIAISDDILGTPVLVLNGDGDQWLEVGENWLYYSLYTVPPDSPSPLVNIATVSGQDMDLEPVPSMTDTHSMTINLNPALKLEKFGPNTANVGDTIVYTFTVETAGDNASIHNLILTDTLVGLPDYVSGDTDGDDILDVNETWLYSTTYNIPVDAPNLLINVARVSGADSSAAPVSANDSHTVVIHFNPALTITKTGPPIAQVGEAVFYFFTLGHASSSDNTSVTAVVVTDSLAGVADYVSGDTNINGSLDMSETWTFSAAYMVRADDLEPLLNQGTVGGIDREGLAIPTASDSHSMDIEYNPALMVDILAQNTAYVGETVLFTYAVSLKGDGSPVQMLEVYDDLAQEATYLSGDTNSNGWLESGENWLFGGATYTVQLTDPSVLNHTAVVTAADRDAEAIIATSAPHLLTKSGQTALNISKSGPAKAVSGDLITYSLTVTNIGSVPAHNLVITDAVPAGTRYQGSGSGSISSGIVSWDISRLDPNQNISVDLSVDIQSNARNADYGVRADGGIITMGIKAVTTSVTFKTFMPILLKPPPAYLYVTNITGGSVTIRVLELGTNSEVIGCTVPKNAAEHLCGEFPPGIYNIEISSVCGSGILPESQEFFAGVNIRTASCKK